MQLAHLSLENLRYRRLTVRKDDAEESRPKGLEASALTSSDERIQVDTNITF